MQNKLRGLRIKRGISQISLSSRIKIHFSTLSRIERGWISGTPEQRRQIARFFKVKERSLFPRGRNSRSENNLNEDTSLGPKQ